MEGGVNPQSGYQQREPEPNIPPLQSESVQFEATFSEPMLSEPTFIVGPSTQSSFTEPHHTEIPSPQAPLALDHAPWMDLYAQISFLGTRMEELAMVSDTQLYSMEDRMDQYQASFTSQFEYLQQRIECIKDRLEHQHKEVMAYLCSMFPPPPPQPLFIKDPLFSFLMLPKKGDILQDLGDYRRLTCISLLGSYILDIDTFDLYMICLYV